MIDTIIVCALLVALWRSHHARSVGGAMAALSALGILLGDIASALSGRPERMHSFHLLAILVQGPSAIPHRGGPAGQVLSLLSPLGVPAFVALVSLLPMVAVGTRLKRIFPEGQEAMCLHGLRMAFIVAFVFASMVLVLGLCAGAVTRSL